MSTEHVLVFIRYRFEVHPSGEIVTLSQNGVPWKEHLLNIETELGVETPIKYVLYRDAANDRWRIQCVPIRANSFTNRLTMPAEWCGIRDEALSKLSGIPGCVFVHANGFIGGNLTFEGVLKMASESLRIGSSK